MIFRRLFMTSPPTRSRLQQGLCDPLVPCPILRCPAGSVGGSRVSAVLKEKIDDLELLVGHPRGAAGSRRLNRQVKGRGAALPQRAIGSSSQSKQLTDGRYASRADRPMKRCGTAAVAPVDLGSALHERLDERGLCGGIPGTP